MRFHFIKQLDSMQCGVACLAMICRHYGKRYSVEDLSQLCRASTEGVSLLSISESGEQIGFDSMFGRASIEQLINIARPCILHWKQNHFVVLYRIKNGKKFYIADPACRVHLDGHVLILRYLVDIAHSLQIASPPKNWRPQDLHLYKCFRPLTPFLTTSEEPQKKHFLKHINDNLRKDI